MYKKDTDYTITNFRNKYIKSYFTKYIREYFQHEIYDNNYQFEFCSNEKLFDKTELKRKMEEVALEKDFPYSWNNCYMKSSILLHLPIEKLFMEILNLSFSVEISFFEKTTSIFFKFGLDLGDYYVFNTDSTPILYFVFQKILTHNFTNVLNELKRLKDCLKINQKEIQIAQSSIYSLVYSLVQDDFQVDSMLEVNWIYTVLTLNGEVNYIFHKEFLFNPNNFKERLKKYFPKCH